MISLILQFRLITLFNKNYLLNKKGIYSEKVNYT